MAVTIELSAHKEGDKVILHLKDSEGHEHDTTITTDVQQGEVVTWTLKEGGNVQEIVNIYPKPNNQDVFSTDPHPIEGSTNWQGVISESATGSESYNIDYKFEGDVITDDPVLKVDPPA